MFRQEIARCFSLRYHSCEYRHEENMTDPEEAASDLPPTLPPAPRPPRVWTVFVVYLLAVVGSIVVQVIAVAVLVVWALAAGTDWGQLQTNLVELLTQPIILVLSSLPIQVGIGVAALVPAYLSPEPTRKRLRLVKAALPAWGYPVVALGSAVPFAVGLALAYALTWVLAPDKSVEMIYKKMTW